MRKLQLLMMLMLSGLMAVAATTQLDENSCGATDVDILDVLYADEVGGAVEYEFWIENSTLNYSRKYKTENYFFTIDELQDTLKDSTVYSVKVRVKTTRYGLYGDACDITTGMVDCNHNPILSPFVITYDSCNPSAGIFFTMDSILTIVNGDTITMPIDTADNNQFTINMSFLYLGTPILYTVYDTQDVFPSNLNLWNLWLNEAGHIPPCGDTAIAVHFIYDYCAYLPFNFYDTIQYRCPCTSPLTFSSTHNPVCSGGDATISITNAVNGWTYTWDPPGCLGATTGDTLNVCPTSQTTYSIVGVNDTTICCNDFTQNVKVDNPVITKNNASVCFGQPVTLTLSESSYPSGIPYTVTWYDTSGTSLNTGITYGATTSDLYVACYTVPSGCTYCDTIQVDTCCMNDQITVDTLSGTYSGLTFKQPSDPPYLPTLSPNRSIFVSDDVIIKDYNDGIASNGALNWDSLTFIVNGASSGSTITKSYIRLDNTEANITNCSFESVCDVMWGGFILTNMSLVDATGITFSNCVFRDAYKAIQVGTPTLHDGHDTLVIDSCNFLNNYIGIEYEAEFGQSISDLLTITSDSFDCDFTTMKIPYEDYSSFAHIYIRGSNPFVSEFDGTKNTNNYYKNTLYGIYYTNRMYEANGPNNVFENNYIAGIYLDDDGATPKLNVDSCTFNFADSIPSGMQTPSTITHSYGIWFKGDADLNVSNSSFVSSLASDYQILKRTGINHTLVNGSSVVDKSTFTQMTNGINVRNINELSIESNLFTDNARAIYFRDNNSTLPNSNNVSCNEFVKTFSGTPKLTAIEVQSTTTLAAIGACPNPVGTPAGNEMHGDSANFRSIWNNGNVFQYSAFANENLDSFDHNITTNYLTCIPNGADTTCFDTFGIKSRQANPNSGDKIGITFSGLSNVLGNAYPNPTKEKVIIPISLGHDHKKAKVTLTSLIGRNDVAKIEILNPEQRQVELNVSDLPKGVYFYSLIVDDELVKTKRLTIIK